jgi:hypothetical protein
MGEKGWGMIDLVDAAKMIPMKQGTLRVWLSRHPEFKKQYRRGRHRKLYRVLTKDEVEQIRLVTSTKGGR